MIGYNGYMADMKNIRQDFPILNKNFNGKKLVYLDSTATSLKPKPVINAVNRYYSQYSANVFRGIYKISEEATQSYEASRTTIAEFIGTGDTGEIIFTRNASESLNLVYYSWALNNITGNDEVVTTILEHHSNFVPWQQLSEKTGCKLKVWKTDDNYLLDINQLDKLITRKTKLLAITAASNVTGLIVDIKSIARIAKSINPKIKILVDGAQVLPHMNFGLAESRADFLVFSGHKMLGPTGIGVLWARRELLESMSPFNFGGDMISEVHLDKTIFNSIPHKFEAGTPHIAGVIGLGEACRYLDKIGMGNVRNHEADLVRHASNLLKGIKGLKTYGPVDAGTKGGVISFTLDKIHPHDIGQILDEDNVCIRVGFHCAQPLHEHMNSGPTARASFYIYNTTEDIDKLVEGLEKVQKVFK